MMHDLKKEIFYMHLVSMPILHGIPLSNPYPFVSANGKIVRYARNQNPF